MEVVRIGLIGSGFMGKTYCEAFAKYVPTAKLIAIAGGTRAKVLSTEYNIQHEENIGRLLERDDIDAVCIATPQDVHTYYSVAAAKAGKHILLEKPMATTVEDCKAINQACADAKVNLMLSFTQRYRLCNIKAKEIVDSGHIGAIKIMQETMINTDGASVYPVWQRKKSNCGTLLGYGVHNIDRIRWFTSSEIQWVAGHYIIPWDRSESEFTANVFMGLENGSSATLLCDNECPRPGVPTRGFHSLVIGDKGVLDVDAYGSLKATMGGKWEVVFQQEPIDWKREGKYAPARMKSYQAQCQEFVSSIIEQRQPAVTGVDGERAVEVALAAYKSSETKQSVRLR
jgi:predicted dehydrogenase